MKYLNEDQKKAIIGNRYSYYDYDEQTIKDIAKKDVRELTFKDGSTLVQAMFPDNLICSGLFDNFLIFECHDGERCDPPKKAFSNIDDKKLLKDIIQFFKDNNIEYHETWNKLSKKVYGDE